MRRMLSTKGYPLVMFIIFIFIMKRENLSPTLWWFPQREDRGERPEWNGKKDLKPQLQIENENKDGSKFSFFKLSLPTSCLCCAMLLFLFHFHFLCVRVWVSPSSQPKTEVGQHLILCKYSLSSLTEPKGNWASSRTGKCKYRIQKLWPRSTGEIKFKHRNGRAEKSEASGKAWGKWLKQFTSGCGASSFSSFGQVVKW